MAVGSTPAPVAEEQQKLDEKAVENQAQDEVESHVDEEKRSYKINEQGSEGEEVSHEEQQHQADIESKRPCETTGGHIRFRLQKNRESMTMES